MNESAAWDWNPVIGWDTPAGELLLRLASLLTDSGEFQITVFGSAPLQLTLDRSFLSGDVDIFSTDDFTGLIAKAGLGKGQAEFYIEQTPPNVFLASPDWPDRAYRERKDGVRWTFPHPLDILVAKVRRLADKDIEAFRLVRKITNHPSEDELRRALCGVVDMYRPAFDEENSGGDPIANTIRLWRILFGHDIDVRADIIVPALAERRMAYGLESNHKAELRRRLNE